MALFAAGQSKGTEYINNKLQKIDSLIAEKKYDQAIVIIKNIQNTFSFRDKTEDKLAFEYRYAQILFENGDEDGEKKALNKLLVGYEKLKPHSDSSLYLDYLNFLAKIFASSRNFDKAIFYNKIALKSSLKNNDTINILKSLVRVGSFFYAKSDLDSAKFYYRKVDYYPVTAKTENRISNAYNNLGVIAQIENNFSLAKGYAIKALKIKEKQKDSIGIAYSKVNLGNLNHYNENFKEAIKSYTDVMTFLEKDTSDVSLSLKRAVYDNLSVSYDSLGEYENAYRNLLKSMRINEKIIDKNFKENFAEVEAKYNIAKQEKLIEIEKNKAQRAQFLFYGLTFLTLTLLVLAYIFYKNYKLTQQNKLEQEQNLTQTKIINATIDAKEKERKTIAEILHDSVSALLSSANLHLQASKKELKNDVPNEIIKAQHIIDEASVKIRDLSHELISSVLLKFGLAFAIHDLCEKYSNSQLELISDDNGVKRYHQKFEIKIYNIIEELVNNILKHSDAKTASINLVERNGSQLLIQIIDDGKGFDVKKARSKDGLGLSHIEARVKVMKGVFNINSKKGEGTSIFISVPIYKSKEERDDAYKSEDIAV
ncbi:MAG: ATP-binding protein [Bacteroidota bacterium]